MARFLLGRRRATSVFFRGKTSRLVGSFAFKFGLGSAKGFLGFRKTAPLLLGLRDSTSVRLGDRRSTSVFFPGTARRLVGSLAFKFGLGSAKGFLGLRKTTRLLLGLCSSTSFRLGLCRPARVPLRSAPRRLVRSLPFQFSLGNTKSLLGFRKTTRQLLRLRDSTSFRLSLRRATSVFIRATCPLLGSLALEFGPSRTKGLLGFGKTTRLLLRLRGAARSLLSLCRPTRVLLRSAACLLLGSLAFPLDPGSTASLFLGLAGGNRGRQLLTPERFLRVDGVALGKSLPLLRKLLNLDRRSPFPHHLGTIEIIPENAETGSPRRGLISLCEWGLPLTPLSRGAAVLATPWVPSPAPRRCLGSCRSSTRNAPGGRRGRG